MTKHLLYPKLLLAKNKNSKLIILGIHLRTRLRKSSKLNKPQQQKQQKQKQKKQTSLQKHFQHEKFDTSIAMDLEILSCT